MTEPRNPSVGDILDDYVKALETGNAPDRQALLARHADLAEELGAALLGLDFVHGAARSLADDAGEEPLGAGALRALGDYRLLREIGRGGMAVVYEAEQVSLGRRVALKVLPFAAVLDPKQLQRFKNEALAAAHLRHSNIVPVYAVGCERGVHYYAMQYVEGQSLAQAIRGLKGGGAGEGPRTPISSHGSNREPGYVRMAAALGAQAAEALDHAHRLGIVHRDVKPGNLLVDGTGALWVTDFGLATSLNDVGLTMTGEILGTVRYMSPEQALAKRVPIDHRTDVYSLGATLYELFTLEPAFPGDDARVVIQDIAFRDPVLPRRLNPALPVDLETVLLKAMAKDPASRYATAQEMADDLKRYLEDKPVLARRPSLAARAARWSRRHRGVVAASFGLLLLCLAALAADDLRVSREHRHTETALKRAHANLDLARHAVDKFLFEVGIEGFKDGPLPPPAKDEMLRAALRFYENNFDDPASLSKRSMILHGLHDYEEALMALDRVPERTWAGAFVLVERGHLLWHLTRLDEALAVLDRAIESDPIHANAHLYRGNILMDLGRFQEALAAFDRAVEIDPDEAGYQGSRGNALRALGRLADSLTACDRAVALDPYSIETHIGRGNALKLLGRFEDALAAYDRVIALDPDSAEGHVGRGMTLGSLGRFEDALTALDRAIALDPNAARAHRARGRALRSLGRLDDALAALDRAIALDPANADHHFDRGRTLFQKGNPDGAMVEYREALRLRPEFAEAHCNLGDALSTVGDFDEAIREFLSALRIEPDLPETHYNLGCALWNQGDLDGAIREYKEAIRARPDYAKAYCLLGRALTFQGRCGEALPALRMGHDLGSRLPGWKTPSKAWIEDAERKAEIEARLDQVLSGKMRPRDASEAIVFAEVLAAKARHIEAARYYAEAFAGDAALAEDLASESRYNAACSASLAAAGGSTDAAEWRGRALEWLRADLAARDRATGQAHVLYHWKHAPDLAAVRDRLDDLPADECNGWTQLWADVDAVLARARNGK